MIFPLPLIDNPALQKFCAEHNLYEAIAAGYHYAQKFFPTATQIDIDFYPPYRDDEPEEAAIIFEIESRMTVAEVLDAKDRFIEATNDVPGAFYLVTSHRFVKFELSAQNESDLISIPTLTYLTTCAKMIDAGKIVLVIYTLDSYSFSTGIVETSGNF